MEHALDPQYAARLGVNLDDLLVSQPSSGEEALQICEALVRSNSIDVIVVDSVAALVTKQELEGEIGDSTVGAQARLMSAALRKLTSFISKARTVCVFTNQIREKIGVMFGNPETTPGGRALKFYASVRVDIRRIGQIKASDGSVAGNRTKIKVVKNKVAPPFTECEFDIMYNEGISSVGSLLDLAMEYDIIQKRGSWISYNGSQIAQGRDAAKEASSPILTCTRKSKNWSRPRWTRRRPNNPAPSLFPLIQGGSPFWEPPFLFPETGAKESFTETFLLCVMKNPLV